MIGTLATTAPIILPWVAWGVGRATKSWINAKGPAMVFDAAYYESQAAAGSVLGSLGRFAWSPISFWLAGEAANAASPAITGLASAINLAAPWVITAVGNYYFKPVQQGRWVSDDEYRKLQVMQNNKVFKLDMENNDRIARETVAQLL